jgi:Ser/Thr protein kinase RdoA (MazF antagonist)
MSAQLLDVLEGYESFMEFDWREVRLIEPLRTLRMIHHSAWIARRWQDPAFPIAFPWFASPSVLGRPVRAPARAAGGDGRAAARQPRPEAATRTAARPAAAS